MNSTNDERMAVIETEIKGIKKSLEDQRGNFKTLFEKLDALDAKFAGKWVEKVSIGSIIALLVAIISLVIKT